MLGQAMAEHLVARFLIRQTKDPEAKASGFFLFLLFYKGNQNKEQQNSNCKTA